jgi:hypothetical protein
MLTAHLQQFRPHRPTVIQVARGARMSVGQMPTASSIWEMCHWISSSINRIP